MEVKFQINEYTCKSCGGKIVTVNADRGVTPMFIRCRADMMCGGTAVSAGYQVDQAQRPTHEWYRPAGKELRHLDKPMREHIKSGGLKIRRVSVYTLEQIGYGPRAG